jgi:hypothetical protein
MRLELRKRNIDETAFRHDLLLLPSKEESKMLDLVFGTCVSESGLIASLPAECRLSSDCVDHYISIKGIPIIVDDSEGVTP